MFPYEGFLQGAALRPDHAALEIGERSWSYAEVAALSARTAALIADCAAPGERVAVLASRSLTAYVGSLGVFGAGCVHVALNPSYPVERNAYILRSAGVTTLVVEPESLDGVAALAEALGQTLCVVAPFSHVDQAPEGASRCLDARAFESAVEPQTPVAVRDEDLAYIVFTSGSTGQPKGVAIRHDNLAVYMRNFRALAAPTSDDRVVTTYELTFDVALHDLLNAWWSGATLVVMPERAMLAPGPFILSRRISYWFSVASFAMILQRQGLLRPGIFPLLKVSMLCGEALPKATAMAWADAAPNSVLFNVYGPTETTMELAFYRWVPGHSEQYCLRGVVPIGIPFADHGHELVDEKGQFVVGAGEGELYVGGPQIGPGYWGDEARTRAAFVELPGRAGRWYKTGDRVERDELGVYHFVSRVDFMVKVRGHRIELGEIEHALREVSGVDLVAVVPRPAADGTAQGLVGFVCAPAALGAAEIRERLVERLPRAMVPDEVKLIESFPMNANRKVDRGALAGMLRA